MLQGSNAEYKGPNMAPHPENINLASVWYNKRGRGLDDTRQWRASYAVAKIDAGEPTAEKPTNSPAVLQTTGWTYEHPNSLGSRLRGPKYNPALVYNTSKPAAASTQCTRCMFAAGASVALQLGLTNTSS